MFSGCLLTVLCAASLANAATRLADFVTPCSLKDPKLSECATTQAKALYPRLVEGVRDWDAVPLDPFRLPLLEMRQSDNGFLQFSMNITNSTFDGWKGATIESIKIDPKNLTILMHWKFPLFNSSADYVVSGTILDVPITGEGDGAITCWDVDLRSSINFELEERSNKRYLRVKKFKSKITPRKIKFAVNNLFGNKILSDVMNEFLNRNSQAVYRSVRAEVTRLVDDIDKQLLSKIFAKIPFNELFADVD